MPTTAKLNVKINVGWSSHWCATSAQKDNLSTNKLSKLKHLVVGQVKVFYFSNSFSEIKFGNVFVAATNLSLFFFFIASSLMFSL